jgi:hypothetical protein
VTCYEGLILLQSAGAMIATGVVADMLLRLVDLRNGRMRQTVDTQSVSSFELSLNYPEVGDVPVNVTLFKQHGRVRVQVMNYELSRLVVERIEDDIAEALGGRIVARSSEAEEKPIVEAIRRVGAQSPTATPTSSERRARRIGR